jgi:hypothetical protein
MKTEKNGPLSSMSLVANMMNAPVSRGWFNREIYSVQGEPKNLYKKSYQ